MVEGKLSDEMCPLYTIAIVMPNNTYVTHVLRTTLFASQGV